MLTRVSGSSTARGNSTAAHSLVVVCPPCSGLSSRDWQIAWARVLVWRDWTERVLAWLSVL